MRAQGSGEKGKGDAPTSARQSMFPITQRRSTDTSSGGEYGTTAIATTAVAAVTREDAIDAGVR